MPQLVFEDPEKVCSFKDGDLYYHPVQYSHEVVEYMEQAAKEGRQLADEDVQLQVINQLLAKQRRNAIDHSKSGEEFYGAALIETANNQWFIQSNIHHVAGSAARTCAEHNGILEATGHEGEAMQVKNVWFMGGRGNRKNGEMILPGEEGKYYTPCGSCLQMILNTRLTMGAETKVHTLPLNDGTKPVYYSKNTKKDVSELTEGEVFSKTIHELLPNRLIEFFSANNKVKVDIQKAWEALQKASPVNGVSHVDVEKRMQKMHTYEVHGMEKAAKKIHSTMMRAAQEAIQAYGDQLDTVRVVVSRTVEGKYFMGVEPVSDKIQSMHHAYFHAIGEALGTRLTYVEGDVLKGRKFTDVFVMEIDRQHLEDFKSSPPGTALKFTPPTGDALDRVWKRRPDEAVQSFDGAMVDSETGPRVHYLVPCRPQSFSMEKHCVTLEYRDLVPYPFVNPKSQIKPKTDVNTKDIIGVEGPDPQKREKN